MADTGRGEFADYHQLWSESVRDVEWFWDAVWQFFGVRATTHADTVLANREMPGAQWFPGSTLNYVSEVFRHESDGRPALIVAGEDGSAEWSWARLRHETAAFANYLRRLGVKPGDRVVGYLPNVGEAVVAFLAAASVGATWAVCNQDLAVSGVVARLGQLEPTVLVATDGSVYGGSQHDRRTELAEIRRQLPTLKATVVVPRLGLEVDGDVVGWSRVLETDVPLEITPVPFAHPLWVLFSSGTTGTPKGIVHGHGGVVLEHLKYLSLHLDLKPDDRFFWQSSTSWMMWNLLVSGLLVGSTVVLYDGSPTYPHTDGLWQVVADHRVTVFGVGRGLPVGVRQGGTAPRQGLPAGRAARGRRHRFAVARLGFSLDSGRRRPADPGGVGQRRHRRGDGVHRGVPAGADRGRRAELHLPGRGRGSVVRRGPPGDRAGRRTGAHPADAVDAGVLLERPRRQPLPQGVLRQVPGGVVSRRLAHHHRARFGCGAWPFGRHPEPDGRADGQRRDLQRGRNAARDP